MRASGRPRLPEQARDVLGSPAFGAALTTTTIAAVLSPHLIRALIDWPGYLAILAGLAALATANLISRHRALDWHGVLPISALLFVGWCAISVFWSEYQWATVAGVLYQLVVAYLAVFVAVTRDLIQVIRAFGDVLRVLLGTSLTLEILSGLLLDLPITFLGIDGNIAAGGPIQGVVGSRNMLGLLAVVAIVTFAIEYATRSVRRSTAIGSLVLGALTLVLTRSPVSLGIAVLTAVLALALVGIRRTGPERRSAVQAVVLSAAAAAAVLAYILRTRLIIAAGLGPEFTVRLALWRDVQSLTTINPLEGFGWLGPWRPDLNPFLAIRTLNGRTPTSALNAFLDAWFQTGLVGLTLFAVLLGLALVRGWLVASSRRSVAHVWSALVLVVLAMQSTAESSTLTEYGWFLLVTCSMKASQELSWRRGLR